MLAIRLPPEIEAELTALARRTGRTKSFYVQEAILSYLEDLEDSLIAENAWQAFEKSGRKTTSIEDIMKRYDMES